MEKQAKKILESLVPWRAKALLAKPGISQNEREWTADILKKAAPGFIGKPISTDHSELCDKIVGVTTNTAYETGPFGEGLYAEGIGLMDRELFTKLKGIDSKGIPPLLKGVSIAGKGEQEAVEGKDIPVVVAFEPLEWSFTPFPGIPDAQVLEIVELQESLRKKRVEEKKEPQLADEFEEEPREPTQHYAGPDGKALPDDYTPESWGDASFPDSCFLYVPPEAKGEDGSKSLRKLPVRNKDGTLSCPHVRNALARLDGADIPDSAKDAIRSKLHKLMKQCNPDYKPPEESKPTATLKEGTDQATIEANVKNLDEAQKTQPPPPEQAPPTEPPKEAEKPDELKALREQVEALAKQIEELKKPKPISSENQPSALPIDQTPQGPVFESQADIIKRFNELKKQAIEEQTKFSPKNAFRKVALEILSEKQAEKKAWRQVMAEVTKQFEEES